MKISQQEKEKNRKRIIEVAVEIIIEKGFKAATMREFSKNAKIADATIYKYFPTKESILYAYYEDKLTELVEELKSLEKFNTYTLQEQIQTVIESLLNKYLADREFVQHTFKKVFFLIPQRLTDIETIKSKYILIIKDLLDSAIEAGEIPNLAFNSLVCHLLWDYYIGIVLYWITDTSESFSETSQLIDKSLVIIYGFLKAGLVNKIFDLFTYLFRNYMMNYLNMFQQGHDIITKVKTEFMSDKND